MKHQQNDIPAGCDRSPDDIRRLLGLAADDPQRLEWERHAAGCPVCRGELEAERAFAAGFTRLNDPGPAFAAAAVMRRISRGEDAPLRLRFRTAGFAFAGIFVGVLLGLLLTVATPQDSVSGSGDASLYSADLYGFEDAIDDLTWEIAAADEGGSQ